MKPILPPPDFMIPNRAMDAGCCPTDRPWYGLFSALLLSTALVYPGAHAANPPPHLLGPGPASEMEPMEFPSFSNVSSATAGSLQGNLEALDGRAGDQFGISVAVHGDTAVTGAWLEQDGRGAVYIFQRDPADWTSWRQVAKKVPLDTGSDYQDRFGFSVAMTMDLLVVGAYLDDHQGMDNAGSAYVYGRHHGGSNQWGLLTRLTAPDAGDGDRFGVSVAVDDQTIVVGAYRADRMDNGTNRYSNAGAAYVFQSLSGDRQNWVQVTNLTTTNVLAHDEFGISVAVCNTNIAVGAWGDDVEDSLATSNENSGSVYLFARDTETNWFQITNIVATYSARENWFGRSVALDQGTLAVGARFDDQGDKSGSIYIYERVLDPSSWLLTNNLVYSSGRANDELGISLDLEAGFLVAGAYGADNEKGAAITYYRNPHTHDWTELDKLTRGNRRFMDRMGLSVATDSVTTIVGAYLADVQSRIDQGSASIFFLTHDYGDAPDPSYPTFLASNGARHEIVPGVFLGSGLDPDPDGRPHPNAVGDDDAVEDDEDGITFLAPFIASQTNLIEVLASTNGMLDAWIDWNQNGSWADPGEQVFTGVMLIGTNQILGIPVPASAQSGSTYGRFRYSLQGGLSFDGEATDGEVEDYEIQVQESVDVSVIQLASPAPVGVGSNLVYSLIISNAGPGVASNVELQNTIPQGAVYITTSNGMASCSLAAGVVTCSLGAIGPVESIALEIHMVATNATTLTNQCSVTTTDVDLNLANNVDTILVTALDPPVIVTPPVGGVIPVGATNVFSVVAAGFNPFYQWRRGNSDIPGANSSSYVLSNAQTNDSGQYSVVVSNIVGVDRSIPALLSVLEPPTIVVQPTNVIAVTGTTAVFTVQASGTTLQYQWELFGTPIAGAVQPTLSINNVTNTDAGDYRVLVFNAVGAVASVTVNLTIQSPVIPPLSPPVILESPVSQGVGEGGEVTLSVLTSGSLPMSYQWRHGAMIVTNRLLDDHHSFLEISNFSSNDVGNYQVIVTNLAGSSLGRTSQIAVLTLLLDGDFDLMPDSWETLHGLNTLLDDTALDPDGDGFNNLEEYTAGTDPNDPASFFRVNAVGLSGGLAISFTAMPTRTYSLLYKTSLLAGSWLVLTDIVATASNRIETIRDQTTSGFRYYRLATPRLLN